MLLLERRESHILLDRGRRSSFRRERARVDEDGGRLAACGGRAAGARAGLEGVGVGRWRGNGRGRGVVVHVAV